jgi:hypothetical protein
VITVYQTGPCWTLDDRGYGREHFDTEDAALRQAARDFTGNPDVPGQIPGHFTAPCWLVICDHTSCGEILVDAEEEFAVHFDTPAEALTELAEQRHDLGVDGWVMTPDGFTWCPAHRPGDIDQIPVPLGHAEQVKAGQQVLL